VAHTFGAMGERTNTVLFSLDKSMISVMFLAFGLCAASIQFAGRIKLLELMAVVMCSCCACVIRALCQPTRTTKLLNATAFGLQMLLAASPVVHNAFYGADAALASQVTRAAARAILPSVVGGVVYALRFPKRTSPGRFDLFLHSHNVMHVGTSIGSYQTYAGLAEWEWTISSGAEERLAKEEKM